LSTVAGQQAFRELVDPSFQKYLDGYDGHTAKEWGEALYNTLISDDYLPSLIATVMAGNMNQLNSYCMMLQLLAPDENYSVELNKKVLWGCALKYIDNMNSTEQESAKKFITESAQEVLVEILQGKAYPELKPEVEDALKEMKVDPGLSDPGKIESLIRKSDSMIRSLLDIVVGDYSRASFPERIRKLADRLDEFQTWNPEWSRCITMLGHVFSLAILGFAFYNAITGFLKWDDLEWYKKLSLVAGFIRDLGNLTKTVLKMIDVYRDPEATQPELISVTNLYDDAVHAPDTVESVSDLADEQSIDIDPNLSGVDEPGIVRTGEVAGSDVEGSRFAKAMNISEKICKVLNIVGLAAACVALGFQIKGDFDSGQPLAVKIADILQMVVFAIQIAVEVAGFFTSSIAIPILGVVLALIGLVLMIISTIFHKDPPKPVPPVVKFFRSDGKVFLATLDTPPKEWLDEWHKNHPDEDKH